MAQQNISQHGEIYAVVRTMAEEQLRFLTNRYHMNPQEIIHLYTGRRPESASHQKALHAIMAHRMTEGRV